MLNVYTENREWKIKGKLGAVKRNRKYSCCEEFYPDVTFNFNLQRDSPAYRSIIVLPCLGEVSRQKARLFYKYKKKLSLALKRSS